MLRTERVDLLRGLNFSVALSSDCQIRPTEPGDVEQLCYLSRLWENEGCTLGYSAFGAEDNRLANWLDSGYLYVAELESRLTGFASGVVKIGKGQVFKPEGERYLHIHEVYVHPDHRERGVGNQLVSALLDKAKAEGVGRSIVASGNVEWLRTYQFYERHGFRMLSMEMYL